MVHATIQVFKANTNTGSNTAGQTAGGGTGKHASGGVNSANQGIGQTQSNHKMHNVYPVVQ